MRLVGWDEILEGGLAPGATVSSWRGYGGGVAAAKAGHDVVMCPEQHVYLDHRQAPGDDEPIPVGWVRSLEDVYRFEPVPAELDAAAARHVIGTQANLWTEFMDSARDIDYRAFPRLAAFAEVAWSRLAGRPGGARLRGLRAADDGAPGPAGRARRRVPPGRGPAPVAAVAGGAGPPDRGRAAAGVTGTPQV